MGADESEGWKKTQVDRYLSGHSGSAPSSRELRESLRGASKNELESFLAEVRGLDEGDLRASILAEVERILAEEGPGEPVGSIFPAAGTCLGGRYELVEEIGRGGMGVVYRALDRNLANASVAVKLIRPEVLEDEDRLARFVAESETLSTLRDEAVVTIYDRGETASGLPYLVTELLAGIGLDELIERRRDWNDLSPLRAVMVDRPLPETTALRCLVHWTADLAGCLERVHRQGVIHRDLKPSNVYLRQDGTAVLLDFGLARRNELPRRTQSGMILGTLAYLAPEALRGNSTLSVDVWGLSACLLEALTGFPPYRGDAHQVLSALQREDPVRPGVLRPGLPRDLRAILEKGLHVDPRHRYPSALALELDLRAFLEHRPITARPSTAISRLWGKVRRRPAIAIATVTSLIAAMLFLGLLPLWAKERDRTREAERRAVYARIPALLALEGSLEQRLLVPLDERAEYLALLDRLVDLSPEDDTLARLWRAALRLDQGDRVGAADDLHAIARRGDSPYLSAVADRYARASPIRGAGAVDLSDIDVLPRTAREELVAGFHWLRNRHLKDNDTKALESFDRALELTPELIPARDLRLLAYMSLAQKAVERGDDDEAKRLARLAREETWKLSELYGGETARTLAIRGVAEIVLKNYEQAIAPLQGSLALRPARHGPLLNLGIAYHRLHRLDQAIEKFDEAHSLRPTLQNSKLMLAQAYRDRYDYDRALEYANALDADGAYAYLKPQAIGRIHLMHVFAAFADGDLNEVAQYANRAIEALDEAALEAERASSPMQGLIGNDRETARAIRDGDRLAASSRLLVRLCNEPRDPGLMSNLAALIPKDEDPPRVWMTLLRQCFARIAYEQAPNSARIRAVLESVRK